MEVTGKLVKILDLEEGTSKAGKSWQKQSVVIDTGGEFNNLTAVSAFGDKVDKLNRLELGMDVSILCNVYSREYQGKYNLQVKETQEMKIHPSNDSRR